MNIASWPGVADHDVGTLNYDIHTARFKFGANVVIQVLFYRLLFLI